MEKTHRKTQYLSLAALGLVGLALVILSPRPRSGSSDSRTISATPLVSSPPPVQPAAGPSQDQIEARASLVSRSPVRASEKSLHAAHTQERSWTPVTARWETGEPVAGAVLHLAQDSGEGLESEFDELGTTRIPSSMVQADLLVSRAGTRLEHNVQQRGPDGIALELPLRGVLAGTVLVDGVPADRALVLRVRESSTTRDPLTPRVPTEEDLSLRTESEGRFRLYGLRPDWSGFLEPPLGYTFGDGSNQLELPEPQSQLLIELRSGPAITGRVVDLTGAPAGSAEIAYELLCDYARMSGTASSSNDGHFRIPVICGPVQAAEIGIFSPGVGQAELSLDFELGLGLDLGDVLLNPTRSVDIAVIDSAGSPLKGVLLAAGVGQESLTNADGHSRLEGLPLERFTIRAHGLGLRPAFVELGAEERGPIELTMHPTTNLRVKFVTEDDVAAPGIRLRLSGSEMFESGKGTLDPVQVRLGSNPVTRRVTRRDSQGILSVELQVAADADGVAFVPGLLPGELLELEAVDAASDPVGWQQTLRLQTDEQHDLRAVVPALSGRVSGRVTDAAGLALSTAQVFLLESPHPALRCESDGSFESRLLRAEFVDLLVSAPGHAARVFEQCAVGEPLEFALDHGSSLAVGIRDAAGNVVLADSVELRSRGRTLAQGKRQVDGVFTLEHGPEGLLLASSELKVELTGCSVVCPLERLSKVDGIHWVEVETPGRLDIAWSFAVPDEADFAIRLESVNGSSCGHWLSLSPAEARAGTARLESVLPGKYRACLVIDESGRGQGTPRRAVLVEVRSNANAEVFLESQP